jgi:hypothetical protein
MSNEVSFSFSKTFVIHRCLRSKSSLFDQRNDILHLATPTYINKRVLDRAVTLIFRISRGVSTLMVFVLLK